ncbi:4Fe-4S cluster-binding domain-containing protein [Streptomyces sp. NBC_01451]|uniref:4Fe-4S cluster-binding domain-containing protein n=1 Tax=Streptomyces sp. NBC_01451 TaxID=2903872 RepID=UPI002E315A40|nr:4Fe-4S cluster-binding domain-containing protein [Streptomyces sp. NBC_01451]
MTGIAGKLMVNRTHYPVTVLGYGVRAGIWVQGCTLACHGCLAQDTWPSGGPEHAVEPSEPARWVRSLPDPVDGVTVSGGEPFQQPGALAELLAELRTARPSGPGGAVDILVYSGYPWSRLSRAAWARDALALCDAVVAGPYTRRRDTGAALRGSDNQRLVPLTGLGEARYGEGARGRWEGERPGLQVGVEHGRVWTIGIPRPGERDRLRDSLTARGLSPADPEEGTWCG